MVEIAKQCDIWTDPNGDNFYPGLVERVIAAASVPDALRAKLDAGAAAATDGDRRVRRVPA